MSNITKLLMLLAIGLILAAASIWFIGGKKKEYNDIRTVKARAYQVFPYFVEPSLQKKWRSNLVEQHLISDKLEEGAELRTVLNLDGEMVEFNDRVIRFNENQHVSIRSRNQEVTSTTFVRLKQDGDETEIDYRRIVRLGGVKRFMSVFGEDNNQQELQNELQRLIKVVEEETDHSIPDPDNTSDATDEEDATSDESNQAGQETSTTDAG